MKEKKYKYNTFIAFLINTKLIFEEIFMSYFFFGY